MHVFRAYGLLLNQFVAGLLGKCGKVAQRAGVGGKHLKHLTTAHGGQGFFGFQNGQWAVQAACVEFKVNVHLSLSVSEL
jgi:hypothetical protein